MADRFVATSWRRRPEDGGFEFGYECTRFGHFTETVVLPASAEAAPLDAAGRRLASLLHAALGVSYYKAAAAPEIEVVTLASTPAAAALIEALYGPGLGEFFVRNELPYPPRQSFGFRHRAPERAEEAPPPPTADRRAVLAFGGGKDSQVALELLETAGWRTELASAALSERVARTLEAMTPRPLTIVRRTLDPKLIEANRAGALNGHVPVTAINSLILALYAHLSGVPHVVFANERSAEEATLEVGGEPVNHQYSKTFAAERLIRDALAEAGTPVDYFSVLRPFSELWIARRLAADPEALRTFRSCNRNFVQSEDDAPARPWCGQCAKCAFTAAITAPILTRAHSVAVFGADVLDAPAAVEQLAATAGLADVRPWDCVGGALETAAALHHLAGAPEWADALAVRTLAPRLDAKHGADALDAAWAAAFRCEGEHFLPADFIHLCDADADA